MKLQSLNSTAFGKFENNIFPNLNLITGGRYQKTGAGAVPEQCMTYCCDVADDAGVKPTFYYGVTISPSNCEK